MKIIYRQAVGILLLCMLFALPLSAQESAMEQFMSAHSMSMLTADSIVPNHHDMVITALAMQQLTMTDLPAHPAAPHPGPSAQPAPQSCILQIDTASGHAELLSISGQHLADVHFTLVDSTWYKWLSVDPLADKYIHQSPYLYCNGNPIMLIDPDGRDIWELTNEGTIKARIPDKTQDAIALKGQSISFDYGTIDKGYNGEERDNTKFTYFQFAEGKENEAAAAFQFLADNSNVEYALVNTDKDVSSVYTNHKKNAVLTGKAVARVEILSGAKMTENYHSHPNGTMYPSGLEDGGGDIGFARSMGNSSIFYIYPIKSNSVIEYFSNGSYISVPLPWPYKKVGTISPYIRQSGIPALLRKFGL